MAIFCAGSTKAIRYAQKYLEQAGYPTAGTPTHLLLDVPSFAPEGQLRCGGAITELLANFPKDIVVCGGNLDIPALIDYRKIDLLLDEGYLVQNAYLTAEAAVDVAFAYLPVTIRDCPVLITGWGRIGKCLSKLLVDMGAKVTVAIRKQRELAALESLGFRGTHIGKLEDLNAYRLIFNTVPALVLGEEQMGTCREDCVKIDLASTPGMAGSDIIHARGLPGLHLPESSGKLIAERLGHHLKEEGYS